MSEILSNITTTAEFHAIKTAHQRLLLKPRSGHCEALKRAPIICCKIALGWRKISELKRKPMTLIKCLRKAKKEAPAGEKPRGVKTHLRNMIIVPEMIESSIGIYNGKTLCGLEMKPAMIGKYLGEFAITYKPVRHGRP